MKIKKLRFLPFVLIVLLSSCSSMAGRYIGFRLSPDRVKTQGTIDVPVSVSLTNPVSIYLDEYAVPHIQADNEKDLYFALGYMQGRDRRFQLEMLKLLGYGRMRELVGERDKTGILKQTEIVSRMLGFYKDAEYLLQEASEEDVILLKAFAAGVNEATALEPVPMEFRILDYEPELWEPEDSMVIFAMISFGLSKNWEHELTRLELIVHQLRIGQTIERAMEIYKPMYELPPYLITGDSSENKRDIPAVAPELAEYLLQFTHTYPDPDMSEPPEDAGLVYRGMDNWFRGNSASNNWAVSGDWTGTGKSAFATDSHMPHMFPALGYLFHLEKTADPEKKDDTKSYNVIGAGFAGLPAIAFGTNGEVAWGATSNWADVADLYVEKQAPGDPDSYIYEGNILPFQTRTEVFKIRRDDGSFTEETYTVRETGHGVILNDFTGRIQEDFPLVALKRNRLLGRPLSALREVYYSDSVYTAKDAFLKFYAFTGHWALADSRGNIGYIGSVLLPRRKYHLGTLPAPGWIAAYNWNENVPAEEMPIVINPPQGYLGTANNQVIDPNMKPFPMNIEGSTPFRYQRIIEVLDPGPLGRPASEIMSQLQMDDKFVGWELLRPRFAEALTPLLKADNSLIADAADALLNWDGRNLDNSVGPTIFNVFQIQAFKLAIEDEVSSRTLHFYLSFYNLEPFIYDILSDPQNPVWDNIQTDEQEEYGEMLRIAFAKAVQLCADRYGKNVMTWRWERGAEFNLEHPFGTEKALAGFLNRGPLPLHGATDTLFAHQIQRSEIDHFDIKGGPVLRIVVDFADWGKSFMSLPGGESGRPISRHYDDILSLYMRGEGVPLYNDFTQMPLKNWGRIILH